MAGEVHDVFLLLDGLEGAVGAAVHVAGRDVRVLGDHVGREGGGLDGGVGAVLAPVEALLGVRLLVSPHRVVVAGAVAAVLAAVRLVA